MYLVTGGAGFIGSHIVRELNDRGITDIIVVDDFAHGDKFINLSDCIIADYMDKEEFLRGLKRGELAPNINAILHQGACTDTTESDGRYMMDTNFTFSRTVLCFALAQKIPLVYASSGAVYGAAKAFKPAPENERPINLYGYSKLAFDQHVRRVLPEAQSTVVGLRYFNVYGPRETQKGKMASMVYQLHRQLAETGKCRLFEGTAGYADGEQRRDFVFVGDVVKVNLFFADGPVKHGIFNVGTGESRSFNDVARTLIGLRGGGQIGYFALPESLAGKYQSFTEADITTLRQAGCEEPFTGLEDGIEQSVQEWQS